MTNRHALRQAVGDTRVNCIRNQYRTHRGIPRRQAFGDGHDVGFDAFRVASEHRPGPAESGNDFVGDKQDVQFAARVTHGLEPTLGRHDYATGSLYRFAEKSCHAVRAEFHDLGAQRRNRRGDDPGRIRAHRIAIGIG